MAQPAFDPDAFMASQKKFDPDAFMARQQGGEFDPDAFMANKPEEKTVSGFLGNAGRSLWENTGGLVTGAAKAAYGGIEKPVRKGMELATGRSIPEAEEERSFDAAVGVPLGGIQKLVRTGMETATGRK